MSSELQTGNVQDKGMALNASIENTCRAIPSVIAPYGTEVRGSMVLSDIAEVIMGQSPAGDACNTSGEGVPLLNGPTEFGSQYPKPVQYTVDVRKQANKGDLLFCVRGSTTGRMNWADQTYAIGRGLAAIRGKNGYPNSFVRAVIEYKLESLLVQATGSTFPNVGRDQLNGLEFPPVEKTAAIQISSILDPIDDRIALLRETNVTLEAIAQALFKSWFVDFDPVHANAGTQAPSLPPEIQALFPATFTDSPQGPIPDEWRWGTIADLAVLNPESWTAKKHPNTVAYIDLANAKDNVIADIAEFKFDAAPSRARRVLRDGDTIVGTVRPGNRSFAFIHGAANNLTGSTGFAVLRPKHEENTAFTYLAATNDSSIDYLTHIADGGAYPAVKPEVVANLACIVPPVEVLEAFNSVTAELLRKITKNQQQAQVIANLRDTLLPRLISGQIRLPEAEQAIAAITD